MVAAHAAGAGVRNRPPEYGDIFDGSHVIDERTGAGGRGRGRLDRIIAAGGAFSAVEHLKGGLVTSMAERVRRIATGDQVVIGVNRFTESEASPLGGDDNILRVDPDVERQTIEALDEWRAARDDTAVATALAELRRAAAHGDNLMPPSIAFARAGGTTGEWGAALRSVFGEYRGPTGVGGAAAPSGSAATALADVADLVRRSGHTPPKLLVAKPGLDGHSNGAEQIAVAARDAGFEVVYAGIRTTSAQIAATARDEDPDVIGLSILSGSHLELVPTVIDALRAEGVDAPVIVGGIIPESDRTTLLDAGVAAVYTPKDFDLAAIMRDVANLAFTRRAT